MEPHVLSLFLTMFYLPFQHTPVIKHVSQANPTASPAMRLFKQELCRDVVSFRVLCFLSLAFNQKEIHRYKVHLVMHLLA